MDRKIALAGALAALGIVGVTASPVRLEPGTAGWRRLVRGAEPDGKVPRGMVVLLPGLTRDVPVELRIESAAAGPMHVGTSVDGAPLAWIRTPAAARIGVWIPPGRDGARVEVRAGEGSSTPRIRSLTLMRPRQLRAAPALLGFVLAAALTATLFRGPSAAYAFAVGLFAAALLIIAAAPALLLLTLPSRGSLWPVLFPAALLAASAVLASRLDRAARRG